MPKNNCSCKRTRTTEDAVTKPPTVQTNQRLDSFEVAEGKPGFLAVAKVV